MDNGYTSIVIDQKHFLEHRLVWLYNYGYLPEGIIDHYPDKDRSNNRIENLRAVSQQCNIRNTGNFITNTSGVKGVTWDKQTNKWRSEIVINNKGYKLGRYHDFDDAVLARLAAEQCLGWSRCDSSTPAFMYALDKNLIRNSTNELI